MPYFVDESTYLAHHGVKGMKWGQHIFGRDRGGSGRKVGRAQKSEDDYSAEEHRKALREMRYEEWTTSFPEETKALSNAGQKVHRDLIWADADLEAARDDMTSSYSEQKQRAYNKAAENLFNAYAKSFASMRAELDDAMAKKNEPRSDAATFWLENLREEFNFMCRNSFQYGDTVAIRWLPNKSSFNYNGKKLQTKRAKVTDVSPQEMDADWHGEQKYVKAIWDMQDMFDDEYVYPKR